MDRESVPMFVYDLSDLAQKVLLTDRLLFTVCCDNDQVTTLDVLITISSAPNNMFGPNILSLPYVVKTAGVESY